MNDTEHKGRNDSGRLPLRFCVAPLVHLCVVLPLAWHLNIWADEGSTLYTTRNGLFEAFQNTFRDEKQAPLYFLLLSVWRELSGSVFFARLFSVICSFFAVIVLTRLVRRLWNERTALLAGFFFALHPFLIHVALEIRVYALMILLSLVLTDLFFRRWPETVPPEGPRSAERPGRILFIAVAIVALYTNYYLGFLLAGLWVVLLVRRRRKAAVTYLLDMCVVGAVAVLPLLWVIRMQYADNTGGYVPETNFVEGWRILWHHFLTFVLPSELFPPEEQTWISWTRNWIIRLGGTAVLVLLFLRRRLFRGRVLVFGTLAAVVFLFFYAAYLLLGPVYVALRHAAVLFAPVFLLLVAVLSEFLRPVRERRKKTLAVAVLAVLAAFFYVYGNAVLYPELVKRGDWERVAAYIEERERPGQPIVVFSNYEALNLPVYYRGPNRVLPDENFFKWDYEAEFGSDAMWTAQIAYVISVIPKDAREVWLVTEEGCQTTDGCAPLEKFVKENYTVVETKDFYKERIRLLRKK